MTTKNNSGSSQPSGGKSAEEINTEFRSIISHALLGCDTINIPKETWELVFDECTKYAQQYAHQQPVHIFHEDIEKAVDELSAESPDCREDIRLAIMRGINMASQQPVQGYSEAEAIVKELAQWSEKYPRATVYPMTNKQIDEELITIEEKAKRFTSQQPVNDGWEEGYEGAHNLYEDEPTEPPKHDT